jgi:hypothetical protein
VAWTAQVQPFTPAVDLLRNVLVGTPLQHDPWSEVAKLVAFLVVMVPIGLTVVAAALRLGQRQGRILES